MEESGVDNNAGISNEHVVARQSYLRSKLQSCVGADTHFLFFTQHRIPRSPSTTTTKSWQFDYECRAVLRPVKRCVSWMMVNTTEIRQH
ncbi:hypothetical protein EVAR_62895_1 [Eumeta japonica]|uniref:Uncharacterized protein n=1 Tax=Eumeta variegata TaxID=151549 RepID=A0A4C1Y837_EUMVA|nr:hypothetical protein EVAR_62895_1 [Eumeta japonica]